MTTHRTYTCNLCRGEIKPTERAQEEGFGIHLFVGGGLEFGCTTSAENHICMPCARAVHDELRKVAPVAPADGGSNG